MPEAFDPYHKWLGMPPDEPWSTFVPLPAAAARLPILRLARTLPDWAYYAVPGVSAALRW